MSPESKPPANENTPVLVPRNGTGRIEVWHLKGDGRTAESQIPEWDRGSGEFGIVEKRLSDKTLSSEGQAELAERLATDRIKVGSEAVKHSGIYQPGELIMGVPDFSGTSVAEKGSPVEVKKIPFDSLPRSVQDKIVDYRMATRNKRESEAAGDYSQAARDGEEVFRLRQLLSKEARDFLGIGL